MYLQKDWIVKEYDHLSEYISEQNNDLSLSDQILIRRGYLTAEQRASFYNASLSDLHDPLLFADMEKACRAIIEHGEAGELIMIHGDYDVDGLTSTALLIRALKRAGMKCDWVVPDRLLDGYGLSQGSVDKIIELNPGLVITVDCGIASIDEIKQLNDEGIDVIVTDHHECRSELPPALALLNPKIPNCSYPFKGLAGVGVTLKLVQALDFFMNGKIRWSTDLSLAALGTVADVVPLIDENRILVNAGIAQINKGLPEIPSGLCALMELCQKKNMINSGTLGFTIAPRLNAAGRMGDIEPALSLLLTDDQEQAKLKAKKLNDLNSQRQQLEQEIMEQAIAEIESTADLPQTAVLVLACKNWHPGVIGIVCSRLVDLYYRPVIMLAGDNSDNLRGSCRTYGEFDILAALEAAKEYILTFGGHKKAAGLEIKYQQLGNFTRAINEFARTTASSTPSRPSIEVDMLLSEQDLNIDNAESISLLEPFGELNRQPLFISEGFTIAQWNLVGNGRHVKMSVLSPNGKKIDAIAFGMSDADELFDLGDKVDLLYSLEINEWQNRKNVQLMIRDIKQSDIGCDFIDRPWIVDSLYRNNWELKDLANKFNQPLSAFLPEKSDYKTVYQYIKSRFKQNALEIDLKILAKRISCSYRIGLNTFKLIRVLSVFEESKLIKIDWLEKGRCRLALREVSAKVKLEHAPAFRRLQAEGEAQ